MATEHEPKKAKAATPSRSGGESAEVVALRQQEKKLRNKIDKRIPLLPEDRQQEAIDRAQQHLDGVLSKIKALSKAS